MADIAGLFLKELTTTTSTLVFIVYSPSPGGKYRELFALEVLLSHVSY